jgi:hypothetical protein
MERLYKNVGDSLIYYFPKTSDSTNKSAFKDVIECGITIMAAFTAKSTNSDSYDLFGHTMNILKKH